MRANMIDMRRWLAACLLLPCLAGGAAATEDTDTPGPGGWEHNIGISATRTALGGWEYGLPEGDLNFGIGEHGQLLLGGSRLSLREPGAARLDGTGGAVVGLKWRLLDHEKAGFSLAVFPQYTWTPSKRAERSGLVERERSVILPLIVGFHAGETGVFLEAGRKLASNGGEREWAGGIKVLNQCTPRIECRIEFQRRLVSAVAHETTASAGFKFALNESLLLVTGLARDVGTHTGNGALSMNLGFQFVR
ncbi:hypothetical protein [Massilia litorea]|uniref:Transporter n=1 Tax=Massilia litorea TaxID=2769491 RepID=A0A7L9UDS8_9BURK|nr:hypothetical protein [Massilia litorea]QOL52296.1 hypothetical protein LPB04_23590 [Massilia litorea]